jgi:hypothetical protein
MPSTLERAGFLDKPGGVARNIEVRVDRKRLQEPQRSQIQHDSLK